MKIKILFYLFVFVEVVFDDDSLAEVALEVLVAVVDELEKREEKYLKKFVVILRISFIFRFLTFLLGQSKVTENCKYYRISDVKRLTK